MENLRSPRGTLVGWLAIGAFGLVIACFFVAFFTVRVGEVEPTAITGIELVWGHEQLVAQVAAPEAPEEPLALDEETSEPEPAANGSAAEKARRFLGEKQNAPSAEPTTAPAIERPSPERTQVPAAIAMLASAALGLISSLFPQRAARFTAGACAVIGLICGTLLLTGAKDLPIANAGGPLIGSLEVLPAIGFWVAIGCLCLAIVLSALGLQPAPARRIVAHTALTAVPATPAMRTYSSSEKPAQKTRVPEAAATIPIPEPEKPAVIMVPEEPPKGPDTPPPPSSGGWSFKQPEPAPQPPQAPQQPAAPPSSWSFDDPGRSAPPPPAAPPTTPSSPSPSWSFGASGTPPPTPPPAQQPPSPSPSWSFGASGTPTSTPPPPVPPPPPPHNDNPMENQGPAYPPPPPSSGLGMFIGFAEPYFNLIDSGALYRRPFVILYMVFAGLNLLSILGVLGFMFTGGVGPIVMGLFMIFAFWVGFQLWWNRREKVNTFVTAGSEFVALPVFSHLWQTMGEWLGTFVAIAGVGASLGGLISGPSGSTGFGYGADPMAMLGGLGLVGVISCPLIGFMILIFSRAIAEQIRALVAVANNTRNIEANTQSR